MLGGRLLIKSPDGAMGSPWVDLGISDRFVFPDAEPEWHAYLENLLPPFLFYLNEGPKGFEGSASGKTNHLPSEK
jgi:hypothetical protein